MVVTNINPCSTSSLPNNGFNLVFQDPPAVPYTLVPYCVTSTDRPTALKSGDNSSFDSKYYRAAQPTSSSYITAKGCVYTLILWGT